MPNHIQQNKKEHSPLKIIIPLALIASVTALCIFAIPKINTDNSAITEKLPSKITQLAPASDNPDGMRKLMNYNGHRYAFI